MIRFSDRVIIAVNNFANELTYRMDGRHLTTDPLCDFYRAVKPGSRLDRLSRGVNCGRCMMLRAYRA